MEHDVDSHRVQCACVEGGHNKDHIVEFDYWRDDEHGDTLTISTGLAHYKSFFQRAVIALKYALGIDNTHCFYVETVVQKDELLKLKSYIDRVASQFSDDPK